MVKVIFHWPIIFEAMKWELVAYLKEECPVHDAGLRTSIRGKIAEDKLQIWMLNYGLYIEYGSFPHVVPIDALKKWCKDKLGDEKAAWAVQNKIKMYGTRPNNFIERTLKNNFVKCLVNALQVQGAVTVE